MESNDAGPAPYDLNRETQRMQLRAEEFSVARETVPAAEARVLTAVATVTRRLDVVCVHEEATVERRSAHHGAVDAIGADRTIVIKLSRERPVVHKHAIVAEDVVLAKQPVSSVRHVEAALRHEELRVAYDAAADGVR